MVDPTEIDVWDEAVVRASIGDVFVPARALPIPPPVDLGSRIIPTTAGSETPEDACDTARLAAAIVGHRRACLVIRVDGVDDLDAEREAAGILQREGFLLQKPNSSAS